VSVRVAIVDDDPAYRGALADLLALEGAFQLEATFDDGSAVLAAAPAGTTPAWDLVLMDLEMPGIDGIAATAELKTRHPELLVVVLTSFEEPDRIVRAIVAGADGYLVKRAEGREVIEEIRAVVAGGSPLTPSVARSVLTSIRAGLPASADVDAQNRYALSDREAEVLRALVAGSGYKQIGYDLHISVDTVRSHIRKIYRKLRVHSAPEAVARAIRERIV
jgi:DNA-binding NarL/FixJ family response regulator